MSLAEPRDPVAKPRPDPVRVALLLFWVVLATTSLLQKSPTFDEPFHLFQGYRFLRTGDVSYGPEKHPPAMQVLAALTLLPERPELAPSASGEALSKRRVSMEVRKLYESHPGLELRAFPRARLVIVALGALLGWILYAAAAEMHGRSGARLALALYCLDPNLLAHGRLVTTDLGAALGYTLVLWLVLRWARQPSLNRAVVLGVGLGFALLAKFSAVVLLGVVPVAGLALVVDRPGRPSLGRGVAQGAVAFAIAGALVWAVHGFEVGTLEEEQQHIVEQDDRRDVPDDASEATWIERIPLPAPGYAHGIRQNSKHVFRRGHVSYLRGRHSRDGWWWYFPYALAVKTPIATLLLLGLAVASLLARRATREELVLLLVPALYLAIAMKGSLNIGYRHLLPILPLLFILTGRLARPDVRSALVAPFARRLGERGAVRLGQVAVGAALLWLAVGTLRLHPHYLAHFNELVGGPSRGWWHLAGADLDWGQDLPALAAWQEENGVELVRLSYFGRARPEEWGVRWLPIQTRDVEELEPGVYALGASRLVGLQSLGESPLMGFQDLEPTAVLGHSLFVYVLGGTRPSAPPP